MEVRLPLDRCAPSNSRDDLDPEQFQLAEYLADMLPGERLAIIAHAEAQGLRP
jgi:hypothetical protein